MHELTGKTILLTGASKGIGAATAHTLAASGAHLIAQYGSDRAGAERATAGVPEDRLRLVQADLRRPGAAAGLWDEALGWRGAVDVLVNNAAVMPTSPLAGGDDGWDDAWAQAWQVNVKAPADLMREAVRHFAGRRGGILITMSSWVAQRGSSNPDLLAYSASKGAVKALTQTLARVHAANGVLAYLVAPGVVRTRMSEAAAAAQGGEAAVTGTLAMGEWVPPEEIADLVAYLATGTCRHLTGATLDVNGASYVR
jgi:NAD(P)-dependent dehydrogenase (short-subunit alcohol dehydrogenase family)